MYVHTSIHLSIHTYMIQLQIKSNRENLHVTWSLYINMRKEVIWHRVFLKINMVHGTILKLTWKLQKQWQGTWPLFRPNMQLSQEPHHGSPAPDPWNVLITVWMVGAMQCHTQQLLAPRQHSGSEKVNQTEVKSNKGPSLASDSTHMLYGKCIQVIVLVICLEIAPAGGHWSRTVPSAQSGPIL